MNDAKPSNRKIKAAMQLLFPQLVKRYGAYTDCSKAQVLLTCSDLNITEEIIPYLSDVCLLPEEFTKMKSEMSQVNWEEVKNRMSRLVREYRLSRVSDSSHFYESGIGMIPID